MSHVSLPGELFHRISGAVAWIVLWRCFSVSKRRPSCSTPIELRIASTGCAELHRMVHAMVLSTRYCGQCVVHVENQDNLRSRDLNTIVMVFDEQVTACGKERRILTHQHLRGFLGRLAHGIASSASLMLVVGLRKHWRRIVRIVGLC